MHNLSGHSLLVNIRCKVLLTPFQLTWRDSRLNVKIWCNFGFAASAQPFFSQISVYIYISICMCVHVLLYSDLEPLWQSGGQQSHRQQSDQDQLPPHARADWSWLAVCRLSAGQCCFNTCLDGSSQHVLIQQMHKHICCIMSKYRERGNLNQQDAFKNKDFHFHTWRRSFDCHLNRFKEERSANTANKNRESILHVCGRLKCVIFITKQTMSGNKWVPRLHGHAENDPDGPDERGFTLNHIKCPSFPFNVELHRRSNNYKVSKQRVSHSSS